jgi:hypothetical protein
MLNNTKELHGYKLAASDGDIGHVKDFYFDDKTWVVRYVVADTGTWLSGRLVLLSPHALGQPDLASKTLQVNLRKAQIEQSPSIELHKPVSRQYELEYYRYYGWPAYWEGSALWGFGGFPVVVPPLQEELTAHLHHHRDDKHLQSAQAITGYAIQAADGPIGRVTGLMVDDQSWAIRELVVETGHWYAGKEILISPAKIGRISYEDSEVFVNLTKASLQQTADHAVVKAGA